MKMFHFQAALSTRDIARASQQKQEVSLLNEGKDRDKKLGEHRCGPESDNDTSTLFFHCRRMAEDRKNYFDTMERHMFSSKQSTKGTGRESVGSNYQLIFS